MATGPNQRLSDEPMALRNGDRMKQAEFHQAYLLMPDNYHAELIGGIVYEPSPVGYEHSEFEPDLSALLHRYAKAAIGVGLCSNGSVILSEDDEVQPDLFLRIKDEYNGQSKLTPKTLSKSMIQYVAGAPELVAEVAYSSRAIDLHLKKHTYKKHGVCEYLVLCLNPKEIRWFSLSDSGVLKPDANGIFRSVVFPGLWIHGPALLESKFDICENTLTQGLESPEFEAFKLKLANVGSQGFL